MFALLGGALAIAGCSQQAANQQAPAEANGSNASAPAAANLAAPAGAESSNPIIDRTRKVIGTVTVRQEPRGTVLTLEVRELPPGLHGMHIHEVGKCDPPAFESSGAHWNWTRRKHGHRNPAGYHAGDLGNLRVAADGTANDERVIDRKDWNANNPAGLSLIIHADPDDEMTDPSGNSGERIACGLLYPEARP
jgi:Cu-Zn family superoxide dismutase